MNSLKIFVLTIHNPNFSFGPHVRLQSFLHIEKTEDIQFILPKFDKTHSKSKTTKLLLKSLFYLINNRKKIDLIHVVTPPSYPGLIAVFAKKILRIPYIVDIGDPSAENLALIRGWSHKNIRFKLAKKTDTFLYKNARHLILTSPLLTKYIPKNIPRTTILTSTKSKNKFITPELKTNKKCVYLGNYGPLQKIEYILEVFQKAIKKDPNISLDIIGTGTLDPKLQTNLSKNIRILPPIPTKEIPTIIKEYSLGIVSLNLKQSLDYAVPTKVLTYLSSGLPIFGPGGTAIEEITKTAKAGQIITTYDQPKDTQRLIELLNSPNTLKTYSKNSIQYAKTQLSTEDFAKKTTRIYRNNIN